MRYMKMMFLLALPISVSAVQMASQPWTQNRIRESEASIMSNVYTKAQTDVLVSGVEQAVGSLSSNVYTKAETEVLVSNVQVSVDGLASNVYTKTETEEKIVELAPPPGNYETVSNRAMTALQSHQSLEPATNYANQVAKDATNYTDHAIGQIPAPDFTSGNTVLVETIKENAPPPGNYATVSNKAMTAIQSLQDSTNYTDQAISQIPAPDFTSDNEILVQTIMENAPPPGNYATVSNKAMTALQSHQSLEPATNYANNVAELSTNYANLVSVWSTNYANQVAQWLTNYSSSVASQATNYTDSSISTNNPAFVSAVTNCPVLINDADETTMGEYGTYGTLGALLAALAAAITWLKTNKVDANAAITGSTKCKITYDSKGLVTGGADLQSGDIPSITHEKISDFDSAVTAVSPPTDISGKLNSDSAAPDFSASRAYKAGDYATYNGVLYQCVVDKAAGATTPDQDIYDDTVTPATGHWKATDMTTPDATLDITGDGALRVMAADGDQLWRQGYNLGAEASLTLSNETINKYAFSANDTGTVTLVLPKVPSGKVTDFGLDVTNPALDSTAATWPTDFSTSSTYAVGDLVAQDSKIWRCVTAVETAGAWAAANWEEAWPMLSLGAALDSTVSVVVGEGKSLADIFTVKPGTMVRVYFTLTAFALNGLPTYHVASMVVENGGAQA